jgi:hypothetical protein
MNAVNINVSVQCIRPLWVLLLLNDSRVTSTYRLCIDDNLLTERTWAWSDNTFIQENIWIYAEKDSSHILTIEPILKKPSHAMFTLSDFSVTNTAFTSEQINDLTISFTL